jgi:hypothetical protein
MEDISDNNFYTDEILSAAPLDPEKEILKNYYKYPKFILMLRIIY